MINKCVNNENQLSTTVQTDHMINIQIFDHILSYFNVTTIFKTISKIFFKEFL